MKIIYRRAVLILCCIVTLIENSNSNEGNHLYKEDPLSIDELYTLDTDALQKLHENIWNVASKNPDIYFSLRRNFHKFAKQLEHKEQPIVSSQFSQSAADLTQCDKDLFYAVTSVKSQWAFQMLDAFGKPASGLMLGEIKWVGNYDECMAVKAPPGDLSIRGFTGHYCWLTFLFNSNETVTGGLNVGGCLPSSCHDDDFPIIKNLTEFLENIPFLRKVLQKFPKISVTFAAEKQSLSNASIGCIFLCSVFAFLVIAGTFVDILKRLNLISGPKEDETLPVESKDLGEGPSEEDQAIDMQSKEETHNSINASHEQELNDEVKLIILTHPNKQNLLCIGMKFLLCFSALSNAEAILDTSGKGQLQCLHGIRFISMAWVMLGHSYSFCIDTFANILDVLQVLSTWQFQVVLSGTYSVDTFFLLSGCLLTYLFLKNQNQLKTAKEWIYFYVHRYIRLTPVYAMLLFILATWWNNLGLGPFWSLQNHVTCAKTWWWNLLYISNFAPPADMCMGWSWYLANDMQFFVISPIFLVMLRRNRIAGLIIVGVLLVASWIATGVISRVNDVPVLFNGVSEHTSVKDLLRQQDAFNQIYIKPYTRIGPYLIGVLLGYILAEVKEQKAFLHKGLVIGGWLASQVLSLILIYGLLNADLGPITASAYNALSRSAWGISVSWVIFACLTGHGGPVNTLLSWKGFIPLSRLTYCAYLVHPMVIFWFYATLRQTIYFTNAQMVVNYLAFLVLSYGLAFVASLLFEAPIMKLEKIMRSKS